MKGGVPGGKPWILPLVWHREHVAGEEVPPVVIAALLAGLRWRGLVGIAMDPVVDDEFVELLGPEQSGVALAADHGVLGVDLIRQDFLVKRVALRDPGRQRFFKAVQSGDAVVFVHGMEATANHDGGSGGNLKLPVGCALGAALGGIHGIGFAIDDATMKGVLGVGGGIFRTEDALQVGLVLREQPLAFAGGTFGLAVKDHLTQFFVAEPDRTEFLVPFQGGSQLTFLVAASPGPNVAKPDAGQHMEWSCFLPVIGDGDFPEQVVGAALGHFLQHIEVGVVLEQAEIGQLDFAQLFIAASVLFDQLGVGIGRLRVLVETLGVGMGRCRVEVVVALLHVLPVAAFLAAESKQPLLQNG